MDAAELKDLLEAIEVALTGGTMRSSEDDLSERAGTYLGKRLDR